VTTFGRNLDRLEPVLNKRFEKSRNLVYTFDGDLSYEAEPFQAETMDICKFVEVPPQPGQPSRKRYQWVMVNAGTRIVINNPQDAPGTPRTVRVVFELVGDIGSYPSVFARDVVNRPYVVDRPVRVEPEAALAFRSCLADRIYVRVQITLGGFVQLPAVNSFVMNTVLEGELRAGDLQRL
jgi:hypothetical protein